MNIVDAFAVIGLLTVVGGFWLGLYFLITRIKSWLKMKAWLKYMNNVYDLSGTNND